MKLMKQIKQICKKYKIALCYLFGSLQEAGKNLLEGKNIEISDLESDIDFAILFLEPPEDTLNTYALLSIELGELISPFKADLLFLHEVDHLIQFEAIKGINIYSYNNQFRDDYEEKVMMFASDEIEIFKLNEKDLLEAIDYGYFEFKYKAN